MAIKGSLVCRGAVAGLLTALCGCAGLMEYQGAVNTSPASGQWKRGGSLAVHVGFSEDSSSSFMGLGGTARVDISDDYGVFEQGLHIFTLHELQDNLAIFGRAGGLAGVQPLRAGRLSLSAFLQSGAMLCLDQRNAHCVSLGAQAQYIAVFDDTLKDDPWLGVTLGYGQWWRH